MGLIKPTSGLTETQIIALIGQHAPTTEGVNEAKVLELIAINDNTGYTESEIIQMIQDNAPTTEGVNEARVLELIAANLPEGAQIETGSYVGTGTVGVNKPNSITFDNIVPKIVWCFSAQMEMGNYSGAGRLGMLSTQLLTTSYSNIKGFGQTDNNGYLEAKKSADGKTIYWYSTTSMTGDNGATTQNNYSGRTYYYIGIG